MIEIRCQEPISVTLMREAVFGCRHVFFSRASKTVATRSWSDAPLYFRSLETERVSGDWATLLIQVAFWGKL